MEELDMEAVNLSLPLPMSLAELRAGAEIFNTVDRFKTGALKHEDMTLWVRSQCDVDEGSVFFDALCQIVIKKRPQVWSGEEFLVLIGRICWMTDVELCEAVFDVLASVDLPDGDKVRCWCCCCWRSAPSPTSAVFGVSRGICLLMSGGRRVRVAGHLG